MEKFELLWKLDKVVVKEKQVVIKEIERKIISLGVDLVDGSHVNSFIERNDNEIAHVNKKLKMPMI